MPELAHRSHEHQGQANQSHTSENYPPCTESVDYRASHQTKGQASNQKSHQKTLSQLGAAESQRIGKRGIKHGKPIKNNADRKEQIEECGSNNPPAIEDSL